ncbi:MAG: nucleoside 2-deoxyribosyltransferase [Nanoarchaeota archaeon]
MELYLAGPLFTAAERRHNSTLEQELINAARIKGIELNVTSPQRKALQRLVPGENRFNVEGIVYDCILDSSSKDVIVCNLDGADADSGTAVEYGIAIGQRVAQEILDKQGVKINVPKVITYRTDFRTAPEKEVGVNAMLKAANTIHIYHPCFAIETGEFEKFYSDLATKIIESV